MIESFKNLWVEKYRPTKLDDIILSNDNRKYFEDIIKKQEIPHLLLFGVQGGGKSSLAKIIVKELLDCQYLYLNASSENGIDIIRSKITNFIQTMSIDNKHKVIILDEADFLTSGAQAALRNLMEEYSGYSRFILTGNYINRLIEPITSRMQPFELIPPIEKCIERCVHIIKSEGIKVENGQKERLSNLIKANYPDLRSIINLLQKYSIDGNLNIPKNLNVAFSFSKSLYEKLLNHENVFEIRKYVIDNTLLFNNDYQLLLKELFETIYETGTDLHNKVNLDQKKRMLLIISEGIYRHQTVLDKEINCFTALIEISEVLK